MFGPHRLDVVGEWIDDGCMGQSLVVDSEVVRGRVEGRRRLWTVEDKQWIVEEAMAPGASVAQVALVEKDLPARELRSENVLMATLKTIAGFLNSGGGTLYIGIDDLGTPMGIAFDFQCVSRDPTHQNSDGWGLALRDFISTRFRDGNTINDYVDCQILAINKVLAARLQIAARKRLSFVNGKDGC